MRKTLGAVLLIVVATTGCANRRWGPCALAGGLLGGAIGGVGAGFAVSEHEPSPTEEEIFGGAAGGMVAGMLIGTLAGHAICDPEDEPPPPPPARY
jgi:hypothetical protein